MSSTYSDLQGNKYYDFSYKREGAYDNVPPSDQQHAYRKASKVKREDLRGKKCPSCGLTRSMSNKCDCNS